MKNNDKHNFALFMAALTLAVFGLQADLARAESDTKEVNAGDLALQVPKQWAEEKTSSNLRLAQLRVPGENDQDAELAIFSFGASDPAANVRRWIGQYESEGRSVKIFSGEAKLGKYLLVDLSGTFKKPVGPPIAGNTELVRDSGTLAVMLQHDGTKFYYLKLNGPKETVAAQRTVLRASFGADAAKEKALDIGSD